MATFLELCKAAAREAGIAGTGPITVVGQSGEAGNIVRWVQSAYRDIQNRNSGHWRWMRHDFTLPIFAGSSSYPYTKARDLQMAASISRFNTWIVNDYNNPPTIRPYGGGNNQKTWMIYVDWEEYRTVYDLGSSAPSKPVHITIDPRDNLVFGPEPTLSLRFTNGTAVIVAGETITGATSGTTALVSSVVLESGSWGSNAAGYIEIEPIVGSGFIAEVINSGAGSATATYSHEVKGEYWVGPQILTADADVPEMPSQFHELIIWYAIEHYGYYEAADEVLARAREMKKRIMRQLERNQGQKFGKSRPLV